MINLNGFHFSSRKIAYVCLWRSWPSEISWSGLASLIDSTKHIYIHWVRVVFRILLNGIGGSYLVVFMSLLHLWVFFHRTFDKIIDPQHFKRKIRHIFNNKGWNLIYMNDNEINNYCVSVNIYIWIYHYRRDLRPPLPPPKKTPKKQRNRKRPPK